MVTIATRRSAPAPPSWLLSWRSVSEHDVCSQLRSPAQTPVNQSSHNQTETHLSRCLLTLNSKSVILTFSSDCFSPHSLQLHLFTFLTCKTQHRVETTVTCQTQLGAETNIHLSDTARGINKHSPVRHSSGQK